MREQLTEYLGRKDAIAKSDLADADQLLKNWMQPTNGSTPTRRSAITGSYPGSAGNRRERLHPGIRQAGQSALGRYPREPQSAPKDIFSAQRVLSGTTVGGIVLSVGAALAVALGLWPRLSEYR